MIAFSGIGKNDVLQVLKPIELLQLKLRCLYEQNGYRKYDMSRFEEYSLYMENRRFLINDAVITFTDLDGRLLALKPDVTLSIVKHSGAQEQRLYYTENVYRPDRAKRSFKEIQQVGLERIGNLNGDVVAEVVALAAGSLKLISEESLLEISHCGFVTGLLNSLSLEDRVRKELIKLIGEKNVHGIKELSRRACLDTNSTSVLCEIPFLSGDLEDVIARARALCSCAEMDESISELSYLADALSKQDGLCKIKADLSLVGQEDYYNGVVFSGYIEGLPFRVLSGGRYDALLERFGNKNGALGFAIYLDELEYMFIPACGKEGI